MDLNSNIDSALRNRAVLFEACSNLVVDIKTLKPSSVPEAVELSSNLHISDTHAIEFSSAMLNRQSKLEVTDVVGLLSNKLHQEFEAKTLSSQAEDLREQQYLSDMAALDAFFFQKDQLNHDIEAGITSEEHHVQNSHNHQYELPHHKRSHPETKCKFELMDRLPGQWSKWTGNVHVSSGLRALVQTTQCDDDIEGETIKIPFKSSSWQPRTKVKPGAVDDNIRLSTAETLESFEDLQISDSISGGHEDPSQTNAASFYPQLAYGKIQYQPKVPSEYWNNLTLTECLMASPFFQHLSSEKFSALEHFAVLRSYKDREVIVAQEQKFYNVFFIRHGAVTVGHPPAEDSNAPSAVLQVLQSGDFFGYECISSNPDLAPSRHCYQALGEQVQCYAIPVEYFIDICLKFPLIVKTAPVHVNMLLETAPAAFGDFAQRSLSKYALIQQETHRVLDAARDAAEHSENVVTISAQNPDEFAEALQKLDRLVNPEFDFSEVIDEFLASSRDLLCVDRAALYVIDRSAESMRFFGVQAVSSRQATNQALQAMAAISVGEGVDSNLSGVIEYVVNHATEVNVANFSSSELYDPSVEKRTCMGRRIKQLLLTPVFDAIGHVIAVLQFTNTKNRDAFSRHDVAVAGVIASRVALIKRIIPDDSDVTPIHAVSANDCLTFRLDHIITNKTNRHLRGTVQLYIGSQPIGPAVATASASTYPLPGRLLRCDFKQDVAIRSLPLHNLPQTTKIIFSFESTNHHPILWCGVYLFDYLRQLKQGSVKVTMWDGAVPKEIPSLLEGLYAPDGITRESFGGKNDVSGPPCMLSTGSVLVLDFPQRATRVVHKIPNAVKYYRNMGVHSTGALNPLPVGFAPTPVPLPASASPTEWYARQMTTSELGIYQALDKIVDVIDPSDIDAETSRLVWRMRNALCVECPWALMWFLLCCDWTNKNKVEEAHRLLYSWGSVTPLMAIQLLDGRLRDPKVRSYAANLIDSLSDEEFQDCLHQLVYCLRFETHSDSALARLLLRRALKHPNSTGKQLLWHLHAQFVRSPVTCANLQRLLKVYLRSLPQPSSAHQGHGLYALQRIDSIYQGLTSSNLLAAKTAKMSSSAEAEHTVNLLLGELNQNPWPSEFLLAMPRDDTYTDGVVQCKKLPHIPHSFVLSLKHPDREAISRVLYSQSVVVKVEILYQQMMHAMNLVWQQEGVNIAALSYEAFVIGGSKSVAQNVVQSGKPLVTLIALESQHSGFSRQSTQSSAASFSPPVSPTLKSAMSARSVPDDLLLQYFATQSNVQATQANTQINAFSDSLRNAEVDSPGSPALSSAGATVTESLAARSNFIRSLAAYFVVCQVLQLREVTYYNTVVTAQGGIFVQNPTSLLGQEFGADGASPSAEAGRSAKAIASSKITACFFPRCFETTLGDKGAPSYSEFITFASAAFLSLRKHVSFLILSLRNIEAQLGFTVEQTNDSTDVLKERLLLKFNDDVALGQLKDILYRSVNMEHPLN